MKKFFPKALLVGGLFGIVVVNAEGEFVSQQLRELAIRNHVSERMAAVLCVPAPAQPAKEEDQIAEMIELVVGLGRKHSLSSVILAGGLHIAGINDKLRARGESLVVIDASLAALNALEGMMRQGLRPSRKVYPKSGSLSDFQCK